MNPETHSQLLGQIADLRRRLEEAEETVRALRAGEVDAVFVEGETDRVYTLEPTDRPYRLAVDTIPEPAATLTVEGDILHCNRRLVHLLERALPSLVGRPLADFVSPESRPALAALLRDGELAEVRGDVAWLPHISPPSPAHVAVRALAEGALGLCLLVVDVSERRHYEELQRTQLALREADRKKDEFLATLAHELRNPLAPMRNAVEILRARCAGNDELAWPVGVLDRQVELMARLLEDLLDVSRISRNRLELRTERVDLAAVVEAALVTSQPLIAARGHQFDLTMPGEPIPLDADPQRLAQVFANLLNNAAKFTEEGGSIRLAAERDGDQVVVTVADTGIGISAEMLPHIFEIFSQENPTEVRSQGGLGVGLSLVKGLVALHGGSVEVHSEGAAQGTSFVVRLPVAVAATLRRKEAARPEASSSTRRVLVVDDNHDSADSLAALLKILGHEVTTAYDGAQAVETAAELRPEVVLLDIGMPVLDGFEACRRIREQPWGRDMHLIALTGWGQDDDRRRSREAGFDSHLVKPVDADELIRAVSSAPGDPAPDRTP
jgi:signal transduction histidine kinase/ActR/RegA family two-component response regulator